MTTEMDRVYELFNEIVELPASQRDEILVQRCGGDEALRNKVRGMLDQETSDTPVTPSGGDADSNRARRIITTQSMQSGGRPATIGHYQILRMIATGGMGTVYEAMQENPRRRVALKVMKEGASSAHSLKRFEHEAHMLGQLRHPCIAQIYEAGFYEEKGVQLPYFAMEFVAGAENLTAFAIRMKLSNRDRLDLMTQICEAVQYAHYRGILHRDLKPDNILITGEGTPKILDFGVARSTDSDIQLTTMRTDIGQLIGTVPYMSPEQAAGKLDELDLRSDVYALGIIGYELLAGRLPYDVREKILPEAVRIIMEQEPTRLSSINRVFHGDIETIFAKALEKDRTRRYQSADELGSDIRRYLDDEPIVARPASIGYQFRKFAKRNRQLVGGVIGVFVVLVIGIIVVSNYAIKEMRARIATEAANKEVVIARLDAETLRDQAVVSEENAKREAALANEISAFLQSILNSVSPYAAKGEDTKLLRKLLADTTRKIETQLRDYPEAEAAIRSTLGHVYADLGDYQEAELHYFRAMDLIRATFSEDHPKSLSTRINLATVYVELGQPEKAEPMMRRTLADCRRVLGPEHVETQKAQANLAILYSDQGRFAESEPLQRELLDIRMKLLGDEDLLTADTMNNLATTYLQQGRNAEGQQLLVEALEVRRVQLGPNHPRSIHIMGNLAISYVETGDFEKAKELFDESLKQLIETHGENHPDTLRLLSNVGYMHIQQANYDEAERVFLDVLDRTIEAVGDSHPDTINIRASLGDIYLKAGRFEDAEAAYGRAVVDWRKSYPNDNWVTGVYLIGHGEGLLGLDRLDEAERELLQAYALLDPELGGNPLYRQEAVRVLVMLYERIGNEEKVREWGEMLEGS